MNKATDNLKFVIVGGRQKNGGSLVLHKLCKELTDMGYDARVFYVGPLKFYKVKNIGALLKDIWFYIYLLIYDILDLAMLLFAKIFGKFRFVKYNGFFNGYSYSPVKGNKRKVLPFVGKNTIVVYPDVIHGNPLHAKRIVRWSLYYPKYDLRDPESYADLYCAYREIYIQAYKDLNPRVLNIQNFDFDLYRNYGQERKGTCYFVRKGANRPDLPEKFDGPILDGMTEVQIAEYLNRHEYCVFYDTASFYMTIATACGCIPVVIPEPGKSRKDYIMGNEAWCGVAFGFDESEIMYATTTAHYTLDYLHCFDAENRRNAEAFIYHCNETFNKKDVDNTEDNNQD